MGDLSRRQRRHMDEAWSPPPWHERTAMTPMDDYASHSTLFACRERLPKDLAPLSLLIVNCGSGVDARFFQVEGATRLTITDVSRRAIALAREHCPGARTVLAETERLPFADGAFDLVGVRSGLHHLERPFDGLCEMARVARVAFFFIEGQHTPLVPLLVRLGLLEAKEDAGNVVYRFTRAEVIGHLDALGVRESSIETGWFMQVPALAALSRHVPGRLPAWVLRGFVWAFNLFFARLGNAMVVVARKRPWGVQAT